MRRSRPLSFGHDLSLRHDLAASAASGVANTMVDAEVNMLPTP
jgi:hypothetical protein